MTTAWIYGSSGSPVVHTPEELLGLGALLLHRLLIFIDRGAIDTADTEAATVMFVERLHYPG